MKKILFLLAVFAGSFLMAQDVSSYIELMKSDIRTEKKAIVAEALNLSDEESSAFWPVYNDYEYELNKIVDQEIALIKEYAMVYDRLTPEKAEELVNKSFKLQESRIKLKKKYFKKLKKVISPISAAKFIQVENQINNLVDLQIASELPLIEKPETMPEVKKGSSLK
ncbi:MAG: hypothetical protein ACE5GL_11990 [Calditrichia bacterium]